MAVASTDTTAPSGPGRHRIGRVGDHHPARSLDHHVPHGSPSPRDRRRADARPVVGPDRGYCGTPRPGAGGTAGGADGREVTHAQPARRRAVRHPRRGDRRGAPRRVGPDPPALPRPHVRRPVDHPGTPAAAGSLPQRGPGLHERGGQGRSPGPRPRGDPRLPGPRLPRAGAGVARAPPRDDGVAGLRGRPRGVRAAAARGDGARRPGRPAGRSPSATAASPGGVPGRGHRLRAVGPAGRHPTAGGRHPVHHRGEERRRRRHVVGEFLPRCPGRRRQPLLLLLVRAERPLDRVLRPAARAPALLRVGHGQARHPAPRAVGDRGARRDLGRGHAPPGPSAPGPPTGPRTC